MRKFMLHIYLNIHGYESLKESINSFGFYKLCYLFSYMLKKKLNGRRYILSTNFFITASVYE